MGLFTKDIKTMDDLFLHTLQDIYYAENKIIKSLPEMIDSATDSQLKSGLQSHLGETKGHVQRLEQVFQMLGQKAKSVDCPAIDGIIDEAEDVTGEVADKDVLDAAIIAAGQAVEHYEITRYGSLIAWAKRLGRNDVAKVLEQTLSEEKAADKKLTTIAESKVNARNRTSHAPQVADLLQEIGRRAALGGGDPISCYRLRRRTRQSFSAPSQTIELHAPHHPAAEGNRMLR
jgi:ferritin-like metal-binding protein YciE